MDIKTSRYRIIIFTIFTLFLIAGLDPIMAEPIENPKEITQSNNFNATDHLLCEEQTRGFEKALAIPSNLLTAISLAETGKWNKKRKTYYSWPWTFGTQGKIHHTPSKDDAISRVRSLQAKGIKSIGVGCMQVNLFYHPKAFENLDAAFDPERNVAYAGNFLAALNQSTRSWPQATANYNSIKLSKNQAYLNKVLGLWQKLSNKSIRNSGFRLSPDPAYSNPVSRLAQTALLKSRFRARLSAERNAQKPDRKKQDLDAWRRGRFDKNFYQNTIAIQKARQARSNKDFFNQGKKTFAQKRQSQLSKWRKNRNSSAFRD